MRRIYICVVNYMPEINHALVEEIRPPIYTAMKYWGKKPHNIWRQYIYNYVPPNGIYLDPFAGSAISAFEAVKAGRKVIAFDLNPLTSFIIEVLSSDFEQNKFETTVIKIIREIEKDDTYLRYFTSVCRNCNNQEALAQNFKWEKGSIYEIGIICECSKFSTKSNVYINSGKNLVKPNDSDIKKSIEMNGINILNWYPNEAFPKSPSFSANFINSVGGNSFSNLWTKRNLYVLSKIFKSILDIEDTNIKKQLLLGFIKTVHLCTKMNVPRREKANRSFSTSWGRSAYLCSSRQMEMNPLLVFQSSCFGKQSVTSAMLSAKSYLPKKPKLIYVDKSNKSNRSNNFDIKYGIIDINTITEYLDEESVDFIMTDPPYGGLVQYLDLSLIWLIWLQKYESRFKPNLELEITIKKGIQELEDYKIRFQNGIRNLYKILKKDGKIVFTFHNKDIKIWNAFLNSISMSGFKIEKVIHQQNRRSGESNVANPYGTSATDFYIRCSKSNSININSKRDRFENFVTQKAIRILAERNEPTPYQILYDGLLVEISNAGFNLEGFDSNIEKTLFKYLNSIFTVSENITNKSGDYWWFVNPSLHIKYPDIPLNQRVDKSILELLRSEVSVTFDDVLAEIFINYPNGLTPDIRSIDKVLKKYATKSSGKWIYKGDTIEKNISRHTEVIYEISKIGKKLGYKIYIGKREQSEIFQGKKLYEIADLRRIANQKYERERIERIEMIDIIWLDDCEEIRYIFEVENTTNFSDSIIRGSNINKDIPKILVIPEERENEFLSLSDPMFLNNFKEYSWKYILYDEIHKLSNSSKLNEINLDNFWRAR